MKSRLITPLIALLLFSASCKKSNVENEHKHNSEAKTEDTQVDTVKKSIPKEEHAKIGEAHLTIKYHAPSVRGRTIWGGLVPYGEVWVTGAHSATTFETDKRLVINGKEIAPGKYALFTIPGKEKWTLILNKNWDQHLADEYNEKDDILRLQVIPEVNESVQERLKYSIVSADESAGSVVISWENVRITMPIQGK